MFNKYYGVVKSPCLQCKDRIILCHSNCVRYISYTNELNETKKVFKI